MLFFDERNRTGKTNVFDGSLVQRLRHKMHKMFRIRSSKLCG